MAALIAATLFSRPTPSGTTSLGKTTASRSGAGGRSAGKVVPCGSMFVVGFVSGSVTSTSFSWLLRCRVDLDRARLGVLRLWNDELEHAVGELGLDLVRVDLDREREASCELPGTPLVADPAFGRDVVGLLQLAAERDRVRRRVDLDVVGREARKVRGQVIRVLRLPEVNRHRKLSSGHSRPRGRTDEAVLEETVHGLAERDDVGDRAETCERHREPPLLQLNAFSALAISWLAARTFVRHRHDARLGFALRLRPVELVRDLVEQVRRVAKLQEQLHSREIDSAGLRQITDRANALEIFIGVEANVGVGPDWIEQALLLVDPERPRMASRETCGDADDIHGSTATCHDVCIGLVNAVVKVLPPTHGCQAATKRARRPKPSLRGGGPPRPAAGFPPRRGPPSAGPW